MGKEDASTGRVARFSITLDELEEGAHVPPEKQVTTSAQDRVPVGTQAEREQLDRRLAGGA